MSYYNHWQTIIESKEKMFAVLEPIIERYIGLPFEERVVDSLRIEVNTALIRNNIEAACEIKVETASKVTPHGLHETISDIKINYLYL